MQVEIDRPIKFSDLGREVIVPDRITPMIELARGKRVLNVGCAGSDALVAANPVHRQLTEVSARCVGIDIFKPGIEKFQADGLDARFADAENFDLPEKDFDLAVMGDVIEHVSNPGKVFDCVQRHLQPGGQVAVTTPNPFSLTLMLKQLLGRPYHLNSEHVFWFDPALLAWLMERSGLKVTEVWWTESSRFAPLRALQNRRKMFHSTFGLVATKVA